MCYNNNNKAVCLIGLVLTSASALNVQVSFLGHYHFSGQGRRNWFLEGICIIFALSKFHGQGSIALPCAYIMIHKFMCVHESEELRDCLIYLSKFSMRNLRPRKGKWFSWCNLIALRHISDKGYYKWEERWGSSTSGQSLYIYQSKNMPKVDTFYWQTDALTDVFHPHSIKDCCIEQKRFICSLSLFYFNCHGQVQWL